MKVALLIVVLLLPFPSIAQSVHPSDFSVRQFPAVPHGQPPHNKFRALSVVVPEAWDPATTENWLRQKITKDSTLSIAIEYVGLSSGPGGGVRVLSVESYWRFVDSESCAALNARRIGEGLKANVGFCLTIPTTDYQALIAGVDIQMKKVDGVLAKVSTQQDAEIAALKRRLEALERQLAKKSKPAP